MPSLDNILPLLTALTTLLGAGGLYGWIKARAEARSLQAQTEDAGRKADLAAQQFYRGVIEDQAKRIESQAAQMLAQGLRIDAQQQQLDRIGAQLSAVTREVATIGDRARRAETEAIRMHDWAEDGCPPPPPVRPPWAVRQTHTHFDPPFSQMEES